MEIIEFEMMPGFNGLTYGMIADYLGVEKRIVKNMTNKMDFIHKFRASYSFRATIEDFEKNGYVKVGRQTYANGNFTVKVARGCAEILVPEAICWIVENMPNYLGIKKDGVIYDRKGNIVGKDATIGMFMNDSSESDLEKFSKDLFAKNVFAKVRQLSGLSYEQAVAINEILNVIE